MGFDMALDMEHRRIKVRGVPKVLGSIISAESLMEHLEREGGVSKCLHPEIPDLIYEVLKSKACRYAVKFNQGLRQEEMEVLVEGMRVCKRPLICAHGRPTVYIIYS
jgi:DNA mismatch repair ATPase MutL